MSDDKSKVKGVVDLVILLDITGSMQSCIDAVKNNIRSFIEGFSTKSVNNENPIKDWRIKVCGYRDQQADGIDWFVDNPFVRDAASVNAQLSAPSMQAKGGGNEPESLLDALFKLAKMGQAEAQEVENPDKWRARGRAARVIVFFTDATFITPMTLPEAAGGGVMDVITALQTAKIVPVGFVPEWSGYDDLAGVDRAELDTYVTKETCPAIAHLGTEGEAGNAAALAAQEALRNLSKDRDGFTKLMKQLVKTVVKSSEVPPPLDSPPLDPPVEVKS